MDMVKMQQIYDRLNAMGEEGRRGYFAKLTPEEKTYLMRGIDALQTPAPEPEKPDTGFIHNAFDWTVNTGQNAAASTVRMVRGGDIKTEDLEGDTFLKRQAERNRKFLEEHGDGAWNRAAQTIGTSLVTAPASLAAGVVGSAVPVPGAGVGLAAATAGGLGYRQAFDSFMEEALESLNEENKQVYGVPLTQAEINRAKAYYESHAQKAGLWEALPEAAGGGASKGIWLGFRNIFGKEVMERAASKLGEGGLKSFAARLGAEAAEEVATETVTGIGQYNTYIDAGLSDDERRSFSSPSDIVKTMKDVAPDVAAATAIMALGGEAARGTRRMLRRHEKQDLLNGEQTEPKETTPRKNYAAQPDDLLNTEENTERGAGVNDEAEFQSVLAWVRDPDNAEPPTQQALLRHYDRVRAEMEQRGGEKATVSPQAQAVPIDKPSAVQTPNVPTEPISAPVANEQQVTPPQAYQTPEGNPERLLSLVSNIDEPVQAQPELTTESWNDYYKQFGEHANDYEWEAIADYFLNPEANSIQPPRDAVERHIDKIYELEDSLTSADKEMIRELASARKQEPVQPDLSIAEPVSRYTNEVADIARDTTPSYISQRQKIADIYKQKMGKALSPKQSLINADKLINAMNTGEHDGWLNPDKKYSRAVFEELTGVKLPNTIEETNRAVAEYVAEKKDTPLFRRSEPEEPVSLSVPQLNPEQKKGKLAELKERLLTELKDTVVTHPDYGEVRIPRNSIKKMLAFAADPRKIAVLEHGVDKLFLRSKHYKTEPNHHKKPTETDKVYKSRLTVDFNGEQHNAEFVVKEDVNGKFKYDVLIIDNEKATSQPLRSLDYKSGPFEPNVALSEDNIIPLAENVKTDKPEYKHSVDKPLKETSDGGRVKHEAGQITPDTRRLEKALERDYRRTLQGRGVQGVSTGESGKEIPAGWIRTHEVSDPLLSRLGRAYGKRVILISNSRPDIVRFEGVTLPSIPDAIFINADASRPHLAIFGHELNHHLKKDLPEVYERLKAELFSMLSPAAIKQYQDKLKDFPEGMDIDLVTDELIGDLVGDSFMKPSFWKTLSERMPEVFRDIAESVIKFFNSALKRMKIRKDLGSTEYFKDMEKAKAAVEKAYTEYAAIMQFENPKPDMYVVHNLTAGKLIHADKIGGLAVPSLAVARTSTGGFESFGEISLIADKDMIDPKKNKSAKTFDADIYSPRYPKDGDTALLENIDHVVRMMNLKPLRGGEGGYYGAGSVRSGVAREFQSIQEIKDSRNKIISKQEFKGVANRAEDDLIRIALQLMPYYKNNPDAVSYIENFGESIREYALEGKKVVERDFSNLPDEQLKQIDGFLNRLAKVPTEYFESKVQRAVGIGEFKYALVPEGTSERVTQILEKHGLEIVSYKKGERAKAVDKLDDVLFKRIIEDKPLFKRTPEEQLSEFEEVESQIRDSNGIKQTGILDKIKDSGEQIKNSMTRHFKHLNTKEHGDLADLLRVFEAMPELAKTRAGDIISYIVKGLTKGEYQVLERYFLLKDLEHDINVKKLYTEDSKLPYSYPSIDAVKKDLAKVQEIVDGNKKIKAAVEKRRAVVRQLAVALVEHGLLPEKVLENPDYFRHQILEHVNMQDKFTSKTSSKDVRNHQQGFQHERTGTDKNWNTSYIEAEFEWIAQAIAQIETKKTLAEIQKKVDISNKVRAKAEELSKGGEKVKWKTLVGKGEFDGYVLWRPTRGHFHNLHTAQEKQLSQLLLEVLPESERKAIESIGFEGIKNELVVKAEVAETLNNLRDFKDRNIVDRGLVESIRSWKVWTLLNPFRWFKYNLNNMTGDLDIVLAYDWKILWQTSKAFRELRAYSKDKTLTAELNEAMKYNVVGSGFSVNEIPDVSKLADFQKLTGKKKSFVLHYADKYWWDFAKGSSNFRENLLRYAAYLHFKEKAKSGRNDLYGVSKKHEIDQIKDPDRRAAKLARELLGDYGNISDTGNWMRERLAPFYSWMEINTPRYVRLIANAKHEGRSGLRAGLIKGAGTTITASAKMFIFYTAVSLWNQTFFPDEDEELKEADRRQLHLILGRKSNGEIISLRMQGALSDAMSWFGMENFFGDLKDLYEGKIEPSEKLKEAADAPFQKSIQALNPFGKGIFELLMGYSTYPDMRNPRPIKDNAEYVARMFSIDLAYKVLAGKPMRDNDVVLFNFMGYTTDPEEAYYYKARGMASDYMESIGKGKNSSRYDSGMKVTAALKDAIKYQDEEAIRKYLTQYIENAGGLGQARKKLTESIERMSPTGLLSKQDRLKFLATLSEKDSETIRKAEAYHRRLMEEMRRIDWAGAMKKSEKYK